MRSPAAPFFLLAALLAGTSAPASSSLVLTDGQVIKGTEIKRRGDSYVVTMAGGNAVTFPAALVKEIRLEDDPKPAAPPGFDFSGPKTLAGPKALPSRDPKDQQKLLGPPSQWTKDIIDPTWTPTSAFDLEKDVLAASRSTWAKSAVDTTWLPTSAFDMSKDILAPTRSTWTKNVIDTTWTPKDGFGFTPLWPGTPPRPALVPLPNAGERPGDETAAVEPVDVTAPAAPAPWSCAEKFFATDKRPETLSVRSVQSRLSDALGIKLYEASGMIGGRQRKAVFTIADGSCRLVGGDADAIIGLNLPTDHAMAQDVASFNAAMASRGGARVPTGVDRVDYAFSFVSLTDPVVSGTTGATLKLIARPEDLRSVAAKSPLVCSLSKGKRRKEERAATAAFAAPKVEAGPEGDVVTFLTWSNAGGIVARNTVVLATSGVVSSKRDVVASHVGAHTD